ncbi:MAG: hypothetical protein AB1568_12460 [Thermodesulfobacteriota bacterium]
MANSPEGFSVGEVHALYRPFRPHHFRPECGCGDPGCDFWLRVRGAGESRLYATIFRLLPDVSFIVDSSKDPWWIRRQAARLRRQGIEVHHLLIWKEPLLFAHSMLKRHRSGWEKAWKNYYRLYLALISDYVPVAYAELAQFPEKTLRSLCESCDLPWQSGRERFWQKQHHTLFGNDSAKFHLHTSGGNDVQDCDTKDAPRGGAAGHRSIYYDERCRNSLPVGVAEALAADPDFRAIAAVLGREDGASDPATVGYTPLQLGLARMCWAGKAVAGRALGRYWRLF